MKTLDAKGENLQPKIDDMVATLREISGEGCGVATFTADCGDCWACVAAACLRRLGVEP